MLVEEQSLTMDKKMQPRAAQASAKALATDTKTKQDVGNNPKLPRSGRRREGNPTKSDPPHKPLPQRQRGFDKRPQPRGNAPFPGNRYRDQIVEVDDVDVGSAAKPGSKKLNLNHLLNFTYDRGEGGRLSSTSWGKQGYHNNRSMWTTRKHKYNKEQFLQANCQFVVQEDQDYSVHHADPDLLVDWKWIEQVRVSCHEVPSCPICLYPPVAAKMTRCGHIYCWPCILHYLALSDKTWRKCPICYEAVYKTDLKSVLSLTTPCFTVGDEITMQLMRRERGSVLVLPRNRWKKNDKHPFCIDDKLDACFAKLLVATKEQVLRDVLECEEQELSLSLEENGNCPEVCFIQAAIEEMLARKKLLLTTQKESTVETETVTTTVCIPNNVKTIVYASAFSDDEECVDERLENLAVDTSQLEAKTDEVVATCRRREESTGSDSFASDDLPQYLEDLEIRDDSINNRNKASSVGKPPGKDVFYFYQAIDGQHVYLHAVNAHMLVREYGSLEQCPDTIRATIVEKEGISMNEELRKRLRYLAHLPLTCEFEVVELQLKIPTVSQETLDAFAEEIEKRKRRRLRRAKEESRREYHLRAEENRRMGKVPAPRLQLNSLRHFPEYVATITDEAEAKDLKLIQENAEASLLSPIVSSLPATPDSFGSPEGNGSSGPSFAQMLREGKAKPGTVGRNKKVVGTACADSLRGPALNSDSDLEEALPAPSFRDSFGAALQDALDKNSTFASGTDNADGVSKKKRKQKRLLFTTSVIRSK